MMSHGHNHSHTKTAQERALFLALILTATFLIIEVIGGLVAESLALLSDAAHMLTDVTALIISIMSIKIGRKPADLSRTFGYYRFEILAAVFNTLLLFLIALYIAYEAYQRISHPANVQSMGMIIVAIVGLIVNIISMRLLAPKRDKSLLMKSAYLEIWSDMVASLGVIIGAIIIYFTQWVWIDSLVALLIGLWVLPRTFILLKESINILLEGVPKEINLSVLLNCMCKTEGVVDVHELHVWAISSDKISLTAHVVIDLQYEFEPVAQTLRTLLASQFNISHTTLQYERSKCLDTASDCYFKLKST